MSEMLLDMKYPLSSDHFGHFDINNSIRLGKAMEKYRLAWLEDMVPWFYTEQWKTVIRCAGNTDLYRRRYLYAEGWI